MANSRAAKTPARSKAGGGTQVVVKSKHLQFRDLLENPTVVKEINQALGQTIQSEQFIAAILTAATLQPELYECTHSSLLSAVYQAASLGLRIDRALGHAYLVPFGKEATLIIGYRGLIELARRSKLITQVWAEPVYVGDDFVATKGTDPTVHHVPDWDVERNDSSLEGIGHFYAVARFADGQTQYEVMTLRQVERIKGRAKSQKGPWSTDPVEMGKKTVVKRLMKYMPLTPQLETAMAIEDAADRGETLPSVVDVPTGELAAPPAAETRADEVLRDLQGEPPAGAETPAGVETPADDEPPAEASAEPEPDEPEEEPPPPDDEPTGAPEAAEGDPEASGVDIDDDAIVAIEEALKPIAINVFHAAPYLGIDASSVKVMKQDYQAWFDDHAADKTLEEGVALVVVAVKSAIAEANKK